MKIIAIDYDGTITDDTPFPFEGNIRPEAKYYIKKFYEDGYTLVLWTCRKGSYYSECLKKLSEEGLLSLFDFSVNTGSGKLEADYYIDDRSVPGKLSWKKWYHYISRRKK